MLWIGVLFQLSVLGSIMNVIDFKRLVLFIYYKILKTKRLIVVYHNRTPFHNISLSKKIQVSLVLFNIKKAFNCFLKIGEFTTFPFPKIHASLIQRLRICILFLHLRFTLLAGQNCSIFTGKWYNELRGQVLLLQATKIWR